MALIEYIGRKPRKEDNVAGTGAVWLGHGDAHEIADQTAARKLLAYDTVWRLVPQPGLDAAGGRKGVPKPPDPGTVTGEPGAPAKYVLQGPDGDMVLDTMKDKELRAFVREKLEPAGVGKDIDLRLAGEKLQRAVYEAVRTAAAVVGDATETEGRKGVPPKPDPGTTTGDGGTGD